MISKPRTLPHLFTVVSILLSTFLSPFGLAPVQAAPQAPLDTPTPVVNDQFTDWTVNDGMAYWAQNCVIIPRQSATTAPQAYLRRRPTNGTITKTLSEQNPCIVKYQSLTADNTGLYYYDQNEGGIFFRPSGSPLDPPTKVFTMTFTIAPANGSRLALSGNFIYWLSSNGKLERVGRDGTGFADVVTGINGPRTFILVGNTVYWLDDSGLWSAPINCATLPCTRNAGPLANANGYYMVYALNNSKLPALSGFSIYWAENGTPNTIRRYSCSFIIAGCSTSTFYDGKANWFIGQPVTDGSNLFWAEYTGSGSGDGHLVRKALGTASNVQPDELVPNVPGIDLGTMFTDNLYVYYHIYSQSTGGPTPGLYKLPFNASAIVRDLKADTMEVTEGIQNLANDVPLAAKKPTYVRAYGKAISGPNATSVDAWLYGTRNGNPLPGSPLHSLNGTRSLKVGGTYDRANLNDGWLFQVPSSWTSAGTVNFQLVVDPQHAYADPNQANNSLTQAIAFTQKGPVCNIFIPVRTNAPIPSTNTPNFWPMIDYAKRLWPTFDYWSYHQNEPMEELEACWWGPFPYPCYGPYEMPDDTWKVFITIGARDLFTDDPDACDNAHASTHYVGMVHPSTNTGTTTGTGMTSVFNYAWVKFPDSSPISQYDPFAPEAGETLAHELGHNMGRQHINNCGADDPDPNYPYPVLQLDNVGATNHYGFDIKTRKPVKPDGAKDFMGYCTPKWVSDYGWKKIFNALSGVADVDAASTVKAQSTVQAQAPDLSTAANVVIVTGAVTPTQSTGFLGYAYSFPTAALSQGILRKLQASTTAAVNAAVAGDTETLIAATNYHVVLRDANNAVLADNPVTPLAPHFHDNVLRPLVFITTFPAPAGAVAKIELLQDSTVIASRSPGLNTPTVSIDKPAGGETINDTLDIQWQATDADPSDILLYAIQYSPDNGAHWQSIANDFIGPQDSHTVSLTLHNLSLPGSLPGQARIRVAASDGYHTGLAMSNGFTVTNRKPEPFIVSPTANETTPAGQPALLRGGANDAEDGGLSDTSLSWTVGGQPAGSGEEVNVSGLAPGEYPVELTAQDSVPQTASAQSTLKITPLGIPQGATPSLDGFCDDDTYANGVEVQLAPYGDNSQASVRLVRDANYLWACFNGLKPGATTPGAFAGLRVDANNSKDNLAQATDYGFFVGEDGGVFTYAGDGAGGFASAGPGGLQAQISVLNATWSAELRIDTTQLGGWDHLVGMDFGHYSVAAANDDYAWPYKAVKNQPNTWALTSLGTLPTLTGLTPARATAGGPAFQMVITGTNFLTNTVVLWDGNPVPATFGSSTQMTVNVGAANIATAHLAQVSTRNPGNIDSNALSFSVASPQPVINNLTPDAAKNGSGTLTVTVNGANFLNGAQVFWNGVAMPTTFVNGGQVTAQVSIGATGQPQNVGVTVLNPDPDGQASNSAFFTVLSQNSNTALYLPLIQR